MSVLTSSTFESCDGVFSVPEKYRDIAFWMLNLAVVPANMTKESDPSTWTQAPRNWQWIQAESEFQVQERPIDANIGTGDALVLEAEPHEQSLQVQVPQQNCAGLCPPPSMRWRAVLTCASAPLCAGGGVVCRCPKIDMILTLSAPLSAQHTLQRTAACACSCYHQSSARGAIRPTAG